MSAKKKIGVLGASGYTGADAVRLLARHPNAEILALTANTHAGKAMDEVFPHFFMLELPRLTEWEKVDWAPQLQGEAVYGLIEFYREKIAAARLVACPGCYPTAALLALVPIARAKLIDVNDIVIDAKSGVTGAGRGLKQNTLFSEAGEGLSPYSVGTHRHSPEIEQEIGVAAGSAVTVNFTPHLIPMSRGELCTSYAKLNGASADDLRAALAEAYRNEPFVHVAKKGVLPQTQNVRGSNYVQIGVFADRIKNRAIVISVLDNLVKGSAGQAIQNMNLMLGFPETTGLEQIALFP